ncbi:MAG TPA: STAS domain-containing protein [bacterium]|nr:STAS domain-containing protein [bacterium]HQL61689.1 STAS domain-containing protein [bacterium]
MQIEKVEKGNTVVLRLTGRVGFEDVSTLQTTLNRLIAKGTTRFLIDCQGMDSLDSSALATFLSTYKRIKNGRIAFVHLSPHVDHVFRETHLDEVFPIYSSAEDAMATLGGA